MEKTPDWLLQGATPVEPVNKTPDWLSQGATPVGEDAPEQDGNVSRGFKTAMRQVPQTFGGAAALAGDAVGSKGLRDWGMDVYNSQEQKIQELSRENDSFTKAISGDGNLKDWAGYGAGYVGGQALQAAATGGAGAFVGRKVAEMAAKKVVKEGIERGIAKEVADKAASEMVSKGLKRGAATGAYASNLMQEAGSIYPEALATAKEEGRLQDDGGLSGSDLVRAGGAAVGAAALDTLMQAKMLKGVMGGGGATDANILKRIAKEAGKGAGREALTEGAQTGIERWGAQQSLGDKEAVTDYIDSAAMGALGGAMGGAGAGVRRPDGATGAQQESPVSAETTTAVPAAAPEQAAIDTPAAMQQEAMPVQPVAAQPPQAEVVQPAPGAETFSDPRQTEQLTQAAPAPKPSESMGLRSDAGGLEAIAAMAVDSGGAAASSQLQQGLSNGTQTQETQQTGAGQSQGRGAQGSVAAAAPKIRAVKTKTGDIVHVNEADLTSGSSSLRTFTADGRPRVVRLPASSIAPVAPKVVLQNRNRSTTASIEQMSAIAAKPDFLRAGASNTMDNGAPIVFGALPSKVSVGRKQLVADGNGKRVATHYAVVEADDVLTSNTADGGAVAEYADGVEGKLRAVAGNGRAAGLKAAWQRGSAGQYGAELLQDAQNLGMDAQDLKQYRSPVLVRIMDDADVSADIGDRSNIQAGLQMSAVEQAANDTRRLSLQDMAFDEFGNPSPQTIQRFMNGMPVQERGNMLDSQGRPTTQLLDRIRAAAFKQAYMGDALVELAAQAADPEAKNILNALAIVAGDMAQLAGTGEFDIRQAVTDAANMAVTAGRTGQPIAQYLQTRQIDENPETVVVMQFFAQNMRSAKRIAEGLRMWASLARSQVAIARENAEQETMFGDTPTLSRKQLFERLNNDDITEIERAQLAAKQGRSELVEQNAEPADPQRAGDGSGAADGASGSATEPTASADADRQDFELEQQTPEQIQAREEAKAAADAEQAQTQRQAAEIERQTQERQDVTQRSQAAADSFELGQSAEDNLTGQADIFSSAPAQPESKPKNLKEALERVRAKKAAEKNAAAVAKANETQGAAQPEALAKPKSLKEGIERIRQQKAAEKAQALKQNEKPLWERIKTNAPTANHDNSPSPKSQSDDISVTPQTEDAKPARPAKWRSDKIHAMMAAKSLGVNIAKGDSTLDIVRAIDAHDAKANGQDVAEATKPAKEIPLSVGAMPNTAEPVSVKDGVVYIGKYEALDFDSGDPVTVPKGSTREQVAKALKDAGVLTSKQRLFGLGELANDLMFSRADDSRTVKAEAKMGEVRESIKKAYGKLLERLEAKGLVTVTHTKGEAFEAASKARADKLGGDWREIAKSMRGSVKNSLSPMKSVQANIRRGQDALAKALNEKATVHRAMFRNGLGWVDFVWGDEGIVKSSGKTKGAMGLAHIAEARGRKEAMPEQRVVGLLNNIVGVIAEGHEFDRKTVGVSTRVGVEGDGTIVWLTKRDGSNAWVVTGYEKTPSGADAGRATSVPTRNAASLTRDDGDGVASIVGDDDLDVKLSSDGRVEGFFDRKTGKSFLIADTLTAKTAPATLMHEVGIHMAADSSMKSLFARAENLLDNEPGEFLDRVRDRMLAAGEISAEESAAYIVTEYEKDRTSAPKSVEQFIKDFMAAVRGWLFRNGFTQVVKAGNLTVADIAAIARANARSLANKTPSRTMGEGQQFSRSPSTKAAYEARIDALFGGEKANRDGIKVLDSSDVFGLMGYAGQPITLAEGKVKQGQDNHQRMTAEVWKKVPEWLENPAAVFDSDTVAGRLVLIATELVNGSPVRMIVEPNTQVGGLQVHLLVNVFDAAGKTPWMRWIGDGLTRYIDKKKFPAILTPSGLQLSRVEQKVQGTGKILTEKNLAGYRKEQAQVAGSGETGLQFSRARVQSIKQSAMDQLDRVLSHPGKVSLWDKTVGTMRHLAERESSFKPVFETAQGFIDDVAMLASDVADYAPRLLPRVESLGDIFGRNRKKTISAQDSKAVAAPLFQGTLNWGRDVDGKPTQVADLKEKYEGKSADDKAQMMLKMGQLDPEILKMWQGMQAEQYEKAIASRFENTFLKGGVVWNDAELVEHFKATPQQISLYREARATIDRSIDMTARADMLRLLGEDYESLRDIVLDAPSLDQATALMLDTLEEDAKADFDSRDRLADLMHGVRQRQEKASDLMKAGYAPLSRFGKYTVDVVDADGKREYFGMFESIKESNAMFADMKKAFPNAKVTQGTISQEEFKLFAGVTPESLELFGNMLGLEGDGNEARDKAFQKYLSLSKNNHSALKRLIHRQGIAGFSEDVGRVLASFVYSNARQAAGGLSAGKLERAISEIPKGKGELRDVAMGLRNYIQDPQEEGQAIRGMLFAQYLGGSVASAFVNMTQPFAVTMPYLSQFGGMAQSSAQLANALKDMANKGFKYETDLANAMQHAEDDGIVSPQEIHQLMGQARGAGGLRVGDGTKLGDAKATASNNWEKLKVLWGQPFALAEQFNRRSTFIAAFRIAKEQGMANPAEFARKAVLDTQFLFSKANKPKWARGAVGGTLFTFKSYSVSYLELLQRTWNAGSPGSPERKAGRRAVAWSMAMLMMMGGAGGLPFMEDLEDLIDGIAQIMGFNFSTKQARKEFLREYLGKEFAEFMEDGVSGMPGAPIDVSGRLGMGNLIPGTGLALNKQNRERDLLEVLGPAGDLVSRGFKGARKLLTGDVTGAALEVSPTAVRNAVKGWDMAASGMYKDTKGYKVMDTTLDEAVGKFLGFQPRSVAEDSEATAYKLRTKSFYTQTSSDIKAQWADAVFRKDDAALQQVRARLATWNKDNPDLPIVVKIPDIMKRVREMGKDRTRRIADTAPKALRAQMRDMAKEATS